MEKYSKDGKKFEREYTDYGSPIFDSAYDYEESRENPVEQNNFDNGFYDPEHKYPVIEETEYDDEGYEVARWIPSMDESQTHTELIAEERNQRKITAWVIIGCLLFVIACFGLALLIVKPF